MTSKISKSRCHRPHPPGRNIVKTKVAALISSKIAAACRNPRSPRKAAARVSKAAIPRLPIPTSRKLHSNSLLEVKPSSAIGLPGRSNNAKADRANNPAVDRSSKITRYSSTIGRYYIRLWLERVLTKPSSYIRLGTLEKQQLPFL